MLLVCQFKYGCHRQESNLHLGFRKPPSYPLNDDGSERKYTTEFEKNRYFAIVSKMNPDERVLLEHTLKLSEENNKILRGIQSAQRRATVYGLIKLALIIVPLVLGYVFIQPYLDQAVSNYNSIQGLFN